MIHRSWGDELVFDKYCGRNGTLIEDVQTHPDKVVPITFRKIRHGSNKPSPWLTKLSPSFRRSILPNDGAIFCPAGFLKSTQCT